MVFPFSQMAISLLSLAKMNAFILVLHFIPIFIIGWVVLMVLGLVILIISKSMCD